jgi:hypothetical protein
MADLTAVDILIEPDAASIERARAVVDKFTAPLLKFSHKPW